MVKRKIVKEKTVKEKITDKQLKIKLLQSAKKYLKESYTSGICGALNNAVLRKNGYSYDNSKEWTACRELKNYISRTLGKHGWYSSWVRDNCEKANFQYNSSSTKFNKQVKKSRKAWVDWMINCLQEDIDKLKGELNG